MKVLKWLDANLEKYLCVVLMSVMTLIIFIQVVARYVFQNSLSWSEELARYIFIWLVYLGISYGCQMRKHIKIDAALQLAAQEGAAIRQIQTIIYRIRCIKNGEEYEG